MFIYSDLVNQFSRPVGLRLFVTHEFIYLAKSFYPAPFSEDLYFLLLIQWRCRSSPVLLSNCLPLFSTLDFFYSVLSPHKCRNFRCNIWLFNEQSGIICSRIYWLVLFIVLAILIILLQYHRSKASIVRRSTFLNNQLP